MPFRKNRAQQVSLFDNIYGLIEREQKVLERSWAKVSLEDVFRYIDKEKFSILYSDKGSRSNTSINVIVGAEIIKMLFDYSDDEMVDNLMLDPRFQLALHTTSFEETRAFQGSAATYREKAGKKQRGYAANVEESVGKNGSVVTDCQFDSNNKSDSEFFQEYIEKIGPQEERTIISTDGAYSGEENTGLAARNNIDLETTDLTGKDVDPVMGEFKLNEEGTRVLHCPAGYESKSNWYNKAKGLINNFV